MTIIQFAARLVFWRLNALGSPRVQIKPLVDAPTNDNFEQIVFDSDGLALEGW